MKFQENLKDAQNKVKDRVNNIDFDTVRNDARHFAHDAQDYAKHKAENVKETLSENVEKFLPLALAAYGGIKTFYGNQKEKYSESSDTSNSSGAATNVLLFVAGAAIGATVGILLAPAKGTETRGRISDETKRVVANAEAKGKKLANEAQDIINKNTETVKTKFQEGKEKATELANDAKKKVNSNVN
ncbi:YtxH domain-containing protein [Bernardetia litoralis]|uniref:YtxH domain-containing protein n=1 Tax=Bernardetia litoralis TaxID=999 RepID=UPI0003127386|nr:YtxH domain-containing protein [Bernardetia litoralis]